MARILRVKGFFRPQYIESIFWAKNSFFHNFFNICILMQDSRSSFISNIYQLNSKLYQISWTEHVTLIKWNLWADI